MTRERRILVTGGAGFIGSHLVRVWLRTDPRVRIVNFDKLTYSGDLSRLADVADHPRYSFIKADICDAGAVERAMRGCSGVVHLAAETHVDRSLLDARAFLRTNVEGTYVLLETARRLGVGRFLTVSTDEVYGSCPRGAFRETAPMAPTNPYSVSKSASDLLTLSYAHTYGLDALVTRGCNTYGPYQYPEKVIPLFVAKALSDEPLPLYGDGRQVRNWVHAEDHALGILTAYRKGRSGTAYNIASPDLVRNVDLTHRLLRLLGKPRTLVRRVRDRLGHDRRYAIDPSRLTALGWKPRRRFEDGLAETVRWYVDHAHWWRKIKDQNTDFKKYYTKAYRGRS